MNTMYNFLLVKYHTTSTVNIDERAQLVEEILQEYVKIMYNDNINIKILYY